MSGQAPARVLVSCLLLSLCLGQNFDPNTGLIARKIRGDRQDVGPPQKVTFLEAEQNTQTIKNNSPRIKRYGVSNETIIIPGRMRNVTVKDAMTRTDDKDDEPSILLEKINASDNTWRGLKTDTDNTEIRESQRSDLELDQHQSLKSSAPGIPETYKVSQSRQGRPKFHIARDDFNFDNEDSNSLRREARLNIANDQPEFPSFATQFFGSFGEFSQSFEGTESSHNDDHYYDPYTKNYNQKPHSDFRPHHHQPQAGFHSQHHGYKPHLDKPRPLKPPKREIISSYHDKSVAHDKYNSIKDVSALYVEDPWKHIDKVVDSAPPYVPKPLHQDGYSHSGDSFQGGFENYNDIHEPAYEHTYEPAYEPPKPVYIPPEPALYEPPRPLYEPVHVEEHIPEVQPVYHPPKPKPVFHYSKPNYRPPIQPKPIKDKHHSIVNVPHYDTPHPEVHSLGGEPHPSEYLHPVQHMKDKKGELDFYKKYANRNHGSKALFKGPPKFRLPGTRASGARFLHLPGGGPGSTFSSHGIEFGAETGGYGAFRWFSDHPARFY